MHITKDIQTFIKGISKRQKIIYQLSYQFSKETLYLLYANMIFPQQEMGGLCLIAIGSDKPININITLDSQPLIFYNIKYNIIAAYKYTRPTIFQNFTNQLLQQLQIKFQILKGLISANRCYFCWQNKPCINYLYWLFHPEKRIYLANTFCIDHSKKSNEAKLGYGTPVSCTKQWKQLFLQQQKEYLSNLKVQKFLEQFQFTKIL